MSQTRYLRSVVDLTWRERAIAFFRGRIAVSAVVRHDGELREIKVGPFDGDETDADHWVDTGEMLPPRRKITINT